MQYRTLPGCGIEVSRLCFGSMTFGRPVDQPTADRMVARCLDAGITFFDSANAYQHGAAEEMLGAALRGRRAQVVLSTKVEHRMGEGPDESGLSRAAILKQAEASLRRLGTDWLDIYFLHQPDYAVPIEETLEAMDLLVRQGKVRQIGSSNYAAWQICEMLWLAEKHCWQPPLVLQSMYNLIARGVEAEYVPAARRLGVATIAYNALAGGLLTGKHRPGAFTPGGRFDAAFWGSTLYQERYWHPRSFTAIEALQEEAAKAGRSLPALALAWLLHHSAADAVLIGNSRPEQLEQNLAAAEAGPLDPATLAACDAAWEELRGPLPQYNR